jgi:hypothetical protein
MTEMLSDSYPPEGVGLKLDRSYEHLVTLDNELRAFIELKPYRISHERWANGTEYVLRANVLQEPPKMLPLILGDCLQNMRTALDHLAWALAIAHTGGEPPRSTSFPIYLSSVDFHKRNKRGEPTFTSGLKKVEAIAEGARTIIEGLQPYHGRDLILDPLWILNEFSRIDRHRKLSLVVAMSERTSVDVGRRSSSGEFVSDSSVVLDSTLSGGAYVHGAKLFHATLREPDPSVYVKYDSPLHITFGNFAPDSFQGVLGESAVDVLSGIYRHIQQRVLPEFADFF